MVVTRSQRRQRLAAAAPQIPANLLQATNATHTRQFLQHLNASITNYSATGPGFNIENEDTIHHNYVVAYEYEIGADNAAHHTQLQTAYNQAGVQFISADVHHVGNLMMFAQRQIVGSNTRTAQLPTHCKVFSAIISFYPPNPAAAGGPVGHVYGIALAKDRTSNIRTTRSGRYNPVRTHIIEQMAQQFNVTHVYLSEERWGNITQLPGMCVGNTYEFMRRITANGQHGWDRDAPWIAEMGLRELEWDLTLPALIGGVSVRVPLDQWRNEV
ncbi:unnamed protein product [Periconia digitata]|uniref:Uncharacterized protein n=1 Tax=Periconia digitata TaxID=1303443 RepID=A0A9W4U3T1_9PLEO|nr:unnamed protein product [Periconia digitata]